MTTKEKISLEVQKQILLDITRCEKAAMEGRMELAVTFLEESIEKFSLWVELLKGEKSNGKEE